MSRDGTLPPGTESRHIERRFGDVPRCPTCGAILAYHIERDKDDIRRTLLVCTGDCNHVEESEDE